MKLLAALWAFWEDYFYWLPAFIGYGFMIPLGHLNCFVYGGKDEVVPGKAPLIGSWDGFYVRYMVCRVRDVLNHVLLSRPGAETDVAERWTHENLIQDKEYTGERRPCLNLASYNYLGFADDTAGISDLVLDSMDALSLSIAAPPFAGGRHTLIDQLEKETARFVNCDDAIVVAQGFATNSLVMPVLAPGKDTLLISDSLNHASLVCGMRGGGGVIEVFLHNNMRDLERLLRRAVLNGQPRTRKPWARIVVVCEGIYSMEGELAPLHVMIPLCRKYKALLWLDEAHSIGALGATGRGLTEFCDADDRGTVIKMGTYTKSFGSVGGYVAGPAWLIKLVRQRANAAHSGESMPPPVAAQCLGTLRHLQTKEGLKRVKQLRDNCTIFRKELLSRRHNVLGHPCSPVVPVILRAPGRTVGWHRIVQTSGLAAVVVGYPATPLTESRVRFCLSAAHTPDQLMKAVKLADEASERTGTLLSRVKEDDLTDMWNPDGTPRVPDDFVGLLEEVEKRDAKLAAAAAAAEAREKAREVRREARLALSG